MPDFTLERAIGGVVAGIDEVGRGPWAGPVVAAAAILDPARMAPELYDEITDSKRLSPARRRALFGAIKGCARLGLGAASAREVERLNVLGATLLAMTRAVAALKIVPDAVLVDGPHVPDLPCPARAVIGGDGLSLSIAAASIVAKVTRDGIMARLARYHPGFGWERNAGYGTAEHRRALDRLGVTPHHRRTFAPIINILSQP